MLIMKVRAIRQNNKIRQLIVTIPKDSGITVGDYVIIEKINQEEIIK